MKKILCIFLLFAMALAFIACATDEEGGGSTDTNLKSTTGTAETSGTHDTTLSPTTTATPATTQVTVTTTAPVTTSSTPDNVNAVKEQVILEQNNIKVTLKSINSDSLFGPSLKVLIENNSDVSVTLQTRNSSVNGVMTDFMFSCSVEPGKKANDEITLSSSDLKRAGISTIKDIEFNFHVFDSSSWKAIFDSDTIVIKTNVSESFVQKYSDTGTLLYEENGLRVILQKIDDKDSFWGTDICVYVENLTQSDVTIQLRNTSVNGFMIDPIFSCDVIAGKRAYDSITFLQSNLTDNGITKIENMEFSLHIFDSDSWKTIKDTDKILVNIG